MANPVQISLLNPVLEDKALQAIQTHLEDKLAWLTTAYGRASKLAITRDGRTIYYPAIPANEATSGKEYITLWPDEYLGNFCFFDLRDEQVLETWGRRNINNNVYRFGASLIFSFNLSTIYQALWKNYTTANIVNDIFYALQSFSSMGVSIIADRYFENTENVYRSYTHNEVKNQFNMRPYGCCRIDLNIGYTPSCADAGAGDIGYDAIGSTQIVYPEN